MTPELAQKLDAAVQRMPAFPQNVQKILTLTRDADAAPKDLLQIIEKDPVITVKVLRVVNSAYYSLPKQMTSINHAVVYLGFNTIKNLALSIAAIGILPSSNEAGFDGQSYLLHSLATAAIARQLALQTDEADPSDCFIAGLLHDFGKVVFAQFMPGEFRKALEMSLWNSSSLHLALQQVIGTDHAVVGAMLARKWCFPGELVDTIECQTGASVKDTAMIACVFAANQISKKLAFGFAGNPWVEPLAPMIERRLGGDLDAVIASMDNLESLFQEASVFAKL